MSLVENFSSPQRQRKTTIWPFLQKKLRKTRLIFVIFSPSGGLYYVLYSHLVYAIGYTENFALSQNGTDQEKFTHFLSFSKQAIATRSIPTKHTRVRFFSSVSLLSNLSLSEFFKIRPSPRSIKKTIPTRSIPNTQEKKSQKSNKTVPYRIHKYDGIPQDHTPCLPCENVEDESVRMHGRVHVLSGNLRFRGSRCDIGIRLL